MIGMLLVYDCEKKSLARGATSGWGSGGVVQYAAKDVL